MMKLIKIFKDWFTDSTGQNYSGTKMIGFSAAVAMTYRFVTVVVPTAPDYVGYGTGISLIIAALAAKHFVEKQETK